jgi:hypothetical protein
MKTTSRSEFARGARLLSAGLLLTAALAAPAAAQTAPAWFAPPPAPAPAADDSLAPPTPPVPVPPAPYPPAVYPPPYQPRIVEAAVVSVAPAPPLKGLSLSLNVVRLDRRDAGYRLFHDSSTKWAPGFEASYDVLRFAGKGSLALGAGVWLEDDDNDVAGGGQQRASLTTQSWYATALARWAIWSVLQPYLSLSGGASRAQAKLTSGSSALTGSATSWFGRAGGGLRLAGGPIGLRPGSGGVSFSFAFSLEGGASLGTPLSFQLEAKPPASGAAAKDLIPTRPVDLGSLSQVRYYTRLVFALLI